MLSVFVKRKRETDVSDLSERKGLRPLAESKLSGLASARVLESKLGGFA